MRKREPRKSGGVGRPLPRALGWPTGLRALRHAAAAPTRQEFEFGKNKGEFGSPYYPLEQGIQLTSYKLRYLNTVRTLTNPD